MSKRKKEANREPNAESDWREGFRGGFGNSGQLSEAAYRGDFDSTKLPDESTQGRSFGTSEVERETQSETSARDAGSRGERATTEENSMHDSELEQSTNRPNSGGSGSSRR